MLNFILEIVCALLMSMSIVFIVIELRSRFDKSFLIFGITNVLLVMFCAIDIWIQPTAQIIYWTRIQHVIAAFFPAFISWYLIIMLRRTNAILIRLMFFIGFCFSPLFFLNIMLKQIDNQIISTYLYDVTFAPYMVITIIGMVVFLIRNLSMTVGKERKVLLFHLFGVAALALGGTTDMVCLIIGHRILTSFSTLGLLFFGLIVTYVFTDKLTAIIRDREITFGKLQAAYKEMEEVQSLKELGQSTAIINHEIKNYTFVISGYAQYLYEKAELNEKHKRIVSTISETAKKMSDFSEEILNFSKAKILSDKRPLAIFPLIERCVSIHFPNKQDAVIVIDPDPNMSIHGDWNKLEHVFVNILKNSFEAGATAVSIKAVRRDTVLLLVIEDNGVGCTEDQLGFLFKSFYTTKKGKGGTGLGMCVIRSIIESHGGYISAYSKNVLNNGTRGLVFNIAFPVFNEDLKSLSDKDLVVLIKEGVENLSQVIRVFQNVRVTPFIIQSVDDFDMKKAPLDRSTIYASINGIDAIKKKFLNLRNIHALVGGTKNLVFVVNELKNESINSFSENYVLENLPPNRLG